MWQTALWKPELDTEKYYKVMVVYLMVYGEETRRTATFADEEATMKIEDRWVRRWLGLLQQLFNGKYSGFCSFE